MKEFPTLTEFIDFIINRSAFLEAVNRANQNSRNVESNARSNSKLIAGQQKNVTQSYVAANNSCVTCSGDHRLHKRKRFLEMSMLNRTAEVKDKRLCIKYLKDFHGRNCKLLNSKICKGYHNTLLHRRDSSNSKKLSKNEEQTTANSKQSPQQTIASSTNSAQCYCRIGDQKVLLATAIIITEPHTNIAHYLTADLNPTSLQRI
jgi:hypothetical protein